MSSTPTKMLEFGFDEKERRHTVVVRKDNKHAGFYVSDDLDKSHIFEAAFLSGWNARAAFERLINKDDGLFYD